MKESSTQPAEEGRRGTLWSRAIPWFGALLFLILLIPALSARPISAETGTGWSGVYLPSTGLVAHVTPSLVAGVAPLSVNWSSNTAGGSPPYVFAWAFGDGHSSLLANPSHTFASAGNFSVLLIVTDSHDRSSRSTATVQTTPKIAGTSALLVRGSVIAVTPSTFWSLDAQTHCAACIQSDPHIRSYLNATPFTWVRYGTNADRCNVSANIVYNDAGSHSAGCGYSISALKSWCNSQIPRCHAILALPGENNNSKEDAALAGWIVGTVGFQPDYWAIGNEPTGWTHYGIPWTQWTTHDHSRATPLAYAFDVKAAITAVKKVNPAGKFIGLEAACSCNNQWFTDVGKIDGNAISAIGYHSYPSTGSTSETLPKFYAPLSSKSNLTFSYPSVRSALDAQCPGCSALPIFVNEYNAGPGWAPSNFGGTYANAVFLAASVTQALQANVTQLTIFNLQTPPAKGYGFSLLDKTGVAGPTGVLFSKVLSQLTLGQVYQSHVSTSVGGLYSVVTRNGASETILAVNANLTKTVALSLWKGLPDSLTGTVMGWSPGQTLPHSVVGMIAPAYSLGPQGILMIQVMLLHPGPPAPGGGPAPTDGPLVGTALPSVLLGRAEGK